MTPIECIIDHYVAWVYRYTYTFGPTFSKLQIFYTGKAIKIITLPCPHGCFLCVNPCPRLNFFKIQWTCPMACLIHVSLCPQSPTRIRWSLEVMVLHRFVVYNLTKQIRTLMWFWSLVGFYYFILETAGWIDWCHFFFSFRCVWRGWWM